MTQGFAGAAVALVSLQPDEALHKNLVQRIFTGPQAGTEVTDGRQSLYSPIGMVVCALPHQRTVELSELCGWLAHCELWTAVWIILRDVNPKRVLPVVGGRYPHFNPCVSSWIDPRYLAAEVSRQQVFFQGEALLLGVVPRHIEPAIVPGQ